MPRYAKNSFEDVVYQQILEEASDDTPSAYVNPDRSEVKSGTTGVSFGDRMKAIKSICRVHELGWITDSNAVEVIHSISQGM